MRRKRSFREEPNPLGELGGLGAKHLVEEKRTRAKGAKNAKEVGMEWPLTAEAKGDPNTPFPAFVIPLTLLHFPSLQESCYKTAPSPIILPK